MEEFVKNEAIRIVRRFYYECDDGDCALTSEAAKKCALITIEEISALTDLENILAALKNAIQSLNHDDIIILK